VGVRRASIIRAMSTSFFRATLSQTWEKGGVRRVSDIDIALIHHRSSTITGTELATRESNTTYYCISTEIRR